jgi:uncharacterized membrane protein
MHRSTRWLIVEVAFLVVVASALGVFGYPMVLPYEWHLFLHILGVILFVGNIVVTGMWMAMAERNHNTRVLRFSAATVNWADVFFTAPGIILIVLNGLFLAAKWGGPFATGWLMAGASLFLVSGVVWVVFLIGYQDKMIRLSTGSNSDAELPGEFFSVLHRWYFWGAVATILPVAASIFMVVKLSF